MKTIELPDGEFDVQDEAGESALRPFGGPFRTREAAEAAQRMLCAFNAVDAQMETINHYLERMHTA